MFGIKFDAGDWLITYNAYRRSHGIRGTRSRCLERLRMPCQYWAQGGWSYWRSLAIPFETKDDALAYLDENRELLGAAISA
jgi:hypothetical protein